MHAFASNSEGDVNTVVDEKGDVVGFAFLVKCFCGGYKDAGFGCFVAVLYNCNAC
jgi:hypothetical protein